MLNSDFQGLFDLDLEESKEMKAEISKETEDPVTDVKKTSLPKSNSHVARASRKSKTKIGKYELLDRFIVVFDAIRFLYVSY